MMWRLLIFLYLSAHLATAQHRALYPSAYRIKRGTYSLVNPAFQRSVDDVDLLFEVSALIWFFTGNVLRDIPTLGFNGKNILLAGSQIQKEDRGGILIPDEELASLRNVAQLEVICDDVLPKSLSEIRRLTTRLDRHRRPLSQQDFERTVLTLVFITQTLEQITDQNQRAAWSDSLIQLFSALRKDLTSS